MQSVDLSSSYFVLFGLPVSFDVDRKTLAERYRELQRTVHPDRFANAADSERRLSVQMAARVNEGFQTLKDPLARGRYMLELQGVERRYRDQANKSRLDSRAPEPVPDRQREPCSKHPGPRP